MSKRLHRSNLESGIVCTILTFFSYDEETTTFNGHSACHIAVSKIFHDLSRTQGSQFFWRSKESIDVAFHYNSDEGLITISTRCPSRGYNYPAIFVDASKIPVSKGDAVSIHQRALASILTSSPCK